MWYIKNTCIQHTVQIQLVYTTTYTLAYYLYCASGVCKQWTDWNTRLDYWTALNILRSCVSQSTWESVNSGLDYWTGLLDCTEHA